MQPKQNRYQHRAYIVKNEYNNLSEAKKHLLIFDVLVKVSKTLYGNLQFTLLGHDLESNDWYPIAKPYLDVERAWSAQEQLMQQIHQTGKGGGLW